MGRVWTLIAGIALGIAITLPLMAFASAGPPGLTGNAPGAGMMTSSSNGQAAPGQQAPEDEQETSELHHLMHQMMDAMMGEGFSERMHTAIPGSEEMMELCAQQMADMGGMMHMMNGGMGHSTADDGGMMGMMRGD